VQVNELLWILIWNLSHVLEPSPQGVLLVLILKVLVSMRTGPVTLRFFSSVQVSTHLLQKLHIAAGEGDLKFGKLPPLAPQGFFQYL
jgi:hypothetical protein